MKDIFALDYARKLKFQLLNEEEEESAQTTASITIPDRDELIRGFFNTLVLFVSNTFTQFCFLKRSLPQVSCVS